MANKSKTEKYLIAYFDILGYTSMIENKTIDEGEFIKILTNLIKIINKTVRRNSLLATKRVKIYSFSDNFCICAKADSEDRLMFQIRELVQTMQRLQILLIEYYGIYIRGSLVIGKLYAGKNIIFGQGIIDAYNMESKQAIYPRIVVDSKLVDWAVEFTKNKYNCFANSSDEFSFSINDINEKTLFYCYDYLFFYNIYVNEVFEYDNLIWDKIFDKMSYSDTISIRKDNIGICFVDFLGDTKGLTKDEFTSTFLGLFVSVLSNLKIKDEHIRLKYLWLCSYINEFCFENNYKQPLDEKTILKALKISHLDALKEIRIFNENNSLDLNQELYKMSNFDEDYIMDLIEKDVGY